jgi:protease I
MPEQLNGQRIAVLAAQGFEQAELFEPVEALERAGAAVHVISPEPGKVRAWNHTDWGKEANVDVPLDDAAPADYDALLLPGGVMNPDRLRMNPKAVEFVRRMFDDGKPIAVICHGPWTLIDAGVARGLTLTSYPSLKTDLTNAGATWVDREVVVDRGIVSSRKPADLPVFIAKMLEEFSEGPHGGTGVREPSHAKA